MKQMLIAYCGKKEMQEDPVAGTGLVWGPGIEHWVNESQGLKLCVHTDSWECIDTRETDGVPETPEVKKDTKPKDEPYANVNLNAMTKDGLCKFAHQNFGQELDQTHTKPQLLEAVKNLMRANDRE